MASKIKILPDHLANMIAAGEVVERPAAVVKELLENALDAGSKRVTVELLSGGRQLIRVMDDGEGMTRDDVLLAIERHATSKLLERADLERIVTFGFRGEALPSIGSVSRVTIDTCAAGQDEGVQVSIHGGQLRDVQPLGRPQGTTVTVRDLFFNVPARRKFMRKETTEFRHCVREFMALALVRYDVAMKLQHNERTVLECQAVSDWQSRASDVFSRDIAASSVEFLSETNGVRISGFLGKPGNAPSSNPDQLIFVNGRIVTSRLLRKAVSTGYERAVAHEAQPFYLVRIEVDPSQVDVNVHPQKKEVRFPDERAIFSKVSGAVKEAFRSADPVFDPSLSSVSTPLPLPEGKKVALGSAIPAFWSPETQSSAEPAPSYVSSRSQTALDLPPTAKAAPFAAPNPAPPNQESQEPANEQQTAPKSIETCWQFRNTYIFVATAEDVWIIDQHIAHERILYEQALSWIKGDIILSQQHLFPVTFELSLNEISVFKDVEPYLKTMGFGLNLSESGLLTVDGSPESMGSLGDGQTVRAMISELADHPESVTDATTDRIAASYACHAAIKAGDPLQTEEVDWLVKELFTTSMPYVCPHGRPIIVKITTDELNSRFGR